MAETFDKITDRLTKGPVNFARRLGGGKPSTISETDLIITIPTVKGIINVINTSSKQDKDIFQDKPAIKLTHLLDVTKNNNEVLPEDARNKIKALLGKITKDQTIKIKSLIDKDVVNISFIEIKKDWYVYPGETAAYSTEVYNVQVKSLAKAIEIIKNSPTTNPNDVVVVDGVVYYPLDEKAIYNYDYHNTDLTTNFLSNLQDIRRPHNDEIIKKLKQYLPIINASNGAIDLYDTNIQAERNTITIAFVQLSINTPKKLYAYITKAAKKISVARGKQNTATPAVGLQSVGTTTGYNPPRSITKYDESFSSIYNKAIKRFL